MVAELKEVVGVTLDLLWSDVLGLRTCYAANYAESQERWLALQAELAGGGAAPPTPAPAPGGRAG